MGERIESLTQLPLDILVLIFPYLGAKSFLALSATCKAFYQPSIRLDPAYWSHATQTTFRVPNQPAVQHDGERWQKLFRRMLTQSRVFTWGNNNHNRLGHGSERELPHVHFRQPRRRFITDHHCSFPTEMDSTNELGVISDMQCGGWSTTLLTSKGALYTAGVMDGQQMQYPRNESGPQVLEFPAGLPDSTEAAAYEEPAIAIRQFSSGRSHVLGVSDSGRIWSWYRADKPALHVKFIDQDVNEFSDAPYTAAGGVKKVVAGWGQSSALIRGAGIVIWDPVRRSPDEDENEVNTMLVMETVHVPKTGYQRVKGAARENEAEKDLGAEVGEVLNYIILEQFIVFVTDAGKVFCGHLENRNRVPEILELRSLRNVNTTSLDVQGSFRSFAIFKNGEVLTAHQDYLVSCWANRQTNPDQAGIEGLKKIPALQHNDVISVAFGDYHFLALHSTGKITAYGTEMQACGALGLGGDGDPEGRIRGIRYGGLNRDGKLLPHAYTHGREVWFEPEKKKFMTYMSSGGKDPGEAKERLRMFVSEANVQGEVSEWFEQESRDWDKDPSIKDANEDGLGAYFALSICAAGWHSGAVVLVNDRLAERLKEKCIIKDPDAAKEGETPEEVQVGGSDSASGSWGLFATLSWLSDLGRAFLGLQPAGQEPQRLLQAALHRQSQFSEDPIAHGASPKKGYKYIWADRSFPRLKLSDGREMPGTVEFDEWKLGRPEWDLTVDV